MPSPRAEIARLWPHRVGESYIRHLIRLNIKEARLNDSLDRQLLWALAA